MLGDTEGPVHKAMLRLQPASVRLEQCWSGQKTNLRFGSREGAPRGGVEGGRVAFGSIGGQAELAAPLPPTSTFLDLDGQFPRTIAKDGGRTGCNIGRRVKRQAVYRGQGRAGHHIPPMPGFFPAELTRWMGDRSQIFSVATTTSQCDHIQVGRRSIEVERDHKWHGPSPTEELDHPRVVM